MIATLRRYIDWETLYNLALFVVAMVWVFTPDRITNKPNGSGSEPI